MKVRITNIGVTDDLYLFMDVDDGCKAGEISFNLVWEDINDIDSVSHDAECAIERAVSEIVYPVAYEVIKEAAQRIRDELTCLDIELEV